MDIIILRHTASLDNEAGIFSRPDTSLSSRGLEEMKSLLAKTYPVERIYTSPYARSLVLAKSLSKSLGLPLEADSRLREIDFGDFEGKTFEEIELLYPRVVEAWMKDPWFFKYPGGEDFLNVRSRVRDFFKDLDSSSLIISHQALIFCLLAEILGYNYKDLTRLQLGSGARIHLRDKPWRLISLENL